MKRIFLFVALSLFYTSAMVVVGGYNVSSDAAQLWNSNRDKNDQSSGSPYFNQQSPSHQSGNHQLFNGDGATINRKDARNQNIEYKKLQRKNFQRVSNRIPAIFEYMSPYAVKNRLDDTEHALAMQAERVRNTENLLKKKRAEDRKYDFQKFKQKNREKLLASMFSGRRYMNARKDTSRDKNKAHDSDQSYKSNSYTTSLSPSTNLFNSTQSSDDKSGQKATLFNSRD